MDQSKFLGHKNLNGHTVSLATVQQMQQQLWIDVLAAAISAGRPSHMAIETADVAIAAFNTRFIPQLETPSPLPPNWQPY